MTLAPCELAVRKYVPAIRASLAIVLVKEYGLSAYRVARLLRLTPAAVSNYLLGRRGGEYVDLILSDPRLKSKVMKVAEYIISSDSLETTSISSHICELCRELQRVVKAERVFSSRRALKTENI